MQRFRSVFDLLTYTHTHSLTNTQYQQPDISYTVYYCVAMIQKIDWMGNRFMCSSSI